MTTEQFFEKFELFAGAPNAVAALRELVLQLAVRGSLTERIDGETCAAQLKLAHAFRVRRAKKAESNSDDIPFTIPANWGWVAVGDCMDMINGKAFKPEDWSTEGTPIIRIQNLNNPNATFNRCKADLDPKVHVHNGDFLISWSGTPGTSFGAFIWDRGFAYLNQHIFRCELVEGVFLKEFLRLAINARLDEMISHAQGAVGLRHITKGKLESIRLPLPPLAEQERIVAKVDELMALCDQLEAQQQERETKHAALSAASLARFAEAPTPANLNFLSQHAYDISPADLRKTILTLAVQGKLVPQDPNDEPAHVLLNKVASTAKTRNRVQNRSSETETPFTIPDTWTWVRLPRVLRKLTDGTHHSPPNGPSGEFMYITAKNIKTDGVLLQGITYVSKEVHEEIYSRCDPSFGDVLYIKDGATTGIAAINQIKKPFSMLSSVALLKPSEAIFNWYLLWAMRSPFFYAQTRGAMKGAAITRVTLSVMADSFLPLPPLAEQKRIVAKVDELMALVDQLEEQVASSRTIAAQLTEAVVAELTAAA
jgi:type I restriction enzyme S subunit